MTNTQQELYRLRTLLESLSDLTDNYGYLDLYTADQINLITGVDESDADEMTASTEAIENLRTLVELNGDLLLLVLQLSVPPQITVDNSVTNIELLPNVLYRFTNRTSNLTITLAPEIPNKINEYHLILEIGSAIPQLTFPNSVTWLADLEINIDTNIEISILNNSAVWA